MGKDGPPQGTGGLVGSGGSTGAGGTGGSIHDASADTPIEANGDRGDVPLAVDADGVDTPVQAVDGAGGSGGGPGPFDGANGGQSGTGGTTTVDAGTDEPDTGIDANLADSAGQGGTGGTTHTGGVTSDGGSTGTAGDTGTGGIGGTGGTAGGDAATGDSATDGAPLDTGMPPYHCETPVVPVDGLVTNFSEWDATTKTWGSTAGLWGTLFYYAGSGATMNPPTVEGTPLGMHMTGSVPANGFAGAGLAFAVCTSVASFTKVQLTIYGGAHGCDLEMQIQTFDQRPIEQEPPGGCDSEAESCFNFPTVKQIVNVSTSITTPVTVTRDLQSFSNWSAARAGQVVGLQWQLTGTNVEGDSCPIDITVADIKFLP